MIMLRVNLFPFLFCTVFCLHLVALMVSSEEFAATAGAGGGMRATRVNKKRLRSSDSLRIHYPYRVFDDTAEGDRPSNWRQLPTVKTLSTNYFNLSYSQDHEDLWLYENWFFNLHGGVIMESGALDGVKYSTTQFFEHLASYMAIHIEADPRNYRSLIANREGSINIQAALCSEPRLLHFTNDNGSEVQGFVEFMTPLFLKKFHNKIYKHKIELSDLPTVKCVLVNNILKEIDVKHIDIWILDIEGAELSVLQGFDFSKVTISAIVIECDKSNESKDAEKISILNKNGYICTQILRNHFCRHESFTPSSTPENFRVYTGDRNAKYAKKNSP